MNKIGFENFRRFKKLSPIEYNAITLLVGRNNAGKSTLVKALLLLHHYFKSDNIYQLSFGNSMLEDANIVTYGRAKNESASENIINFDYQLDKYNISISITGEADKTFGKVVSLIVTDREFDFVFAFDMQNKTAKITMRDTYKSNSAEENIALLQINLEDIESNLISNELKKTSIEYIELLSEKEKIENKISDLSELVGKSSDIDYIIEGDFGYGNSLPAIIEEVISDNERKYNTIFKSIQEGKIAPDEFEHLQAFKDYGFFNIHAGIFDVFFAYIEQFNLEYIGANPAKQSALFSIRDNNNALAQAIHQFKQLNILEGESEHRFVKEWMDKFDVGIDFEIEMHAGEAYEMKIIYGNSRIHLADKGMGSIQAMALIMKLACVIRKWKKADMWEDQFGEERGHTTVIIEEPELNLHPALQGKLADLFWSVFSEFGIHFMIETHSEYILRRSQVLVAENDLEIPPNENPFCVHYFPKENDQFPYQLKYQSDGTFDKNFETGFFDTASLDTLKLLRIKREKKA